MNERIKQLEKQAWDYAYDHETVKGNIANGGFINMNFSDAFSQKFAELIVRECMSQIEEVRQIKAGHAGPVYTQGFEDGMFVAIRTIEEHFGVEE